MRTLNAPYVRFPCVLVWLGWIAWHAGISILVAWPAAGLARQTDAVKVQAAVAKQGKALVEQARAYEHGEGVSADPAQAAVLYCKAIRLGDVEAMFALGWMYANGRGLARNDAHAGYLFKRASDHGHEHAKRMLRYLGGSAEKRPECLAGPAGILFLQRGRQIDERIRKLSPERQAIARLIVDLAPQYQVNPDFALAIALTESALNPSAVSPRNAIGVMQLIPDTAARFNVGNIFDPKDNIKGGLAYLRWLLAYFEGDVVLAAAAYNAGEGAVNRYRGVPPFRETRRYVERIMTFVQRRDHPFDSRIAAPSAMLSALRTAQQEPGS